MKQRPIEYRAWDKQNKEWAKKNIVGNILYEIQVNKDADVLDSYDLSEFTGCLDKNGVKIFEGDVVRRVARKYDWEKFYKNEIPSAHYDEIQISFIEYRGNGFWVHDEDFGYEGEDMWEWTEMEVIGNLFENPELINKK